MGEVILDILLDATKDTLLLVPFLFVTYLFMEWLEHKTSDAARERVRNAGAAGPAVGALLGAVPQCGFSAAAATLYSGRVITLGTLFAVFLSTSDEMLPIFLAEQVPAHTIISMLGTKILIGMAVGFCVDAIIRVLRREPKALTIHELCEDAGCHCDENCAGEPVAGAGGLHHSAGRAGEQAAEYAGGSYNNQVTTGGGDAVFALEAHEGTLAGGNHDDDEDHTGHEGHTHEHGSGSILKSAILHTLQVTAFVFLISLVLDALLTFVGEDALSGALQANAWLAVLASALVGLIPNCAASVAIASLYVQGLLSAGACMGGLLTAAGVGVLVLLRTNKHRPKENIAIMAGLWVVGVAFGLAIDALGIVF